MYPEHEWVPIGAAYHMGTHIIVLARYDADEGVFEFKHRMTGAGGIDGAKIDAETGEWVGEGDD